jgi:predicted outer membrane repeat protein
MKSITTLIAFSFSLSASAATFVVTNINDSGPGSLRSAIDSVNAAAGTSHRIEFAANVNLIDLLTPLPIINKATVEIDASAASGVSVEPINPSASHRLIRVSSSVASLTLRGFSLRSGLAETTGEGGGCLDGSDANSTALLTLDRMQFVNCAARYQGLSRGGAVYWNGLRATVIDSHFESNAALATGTTNASQASGGAIYAREVMIQRSQFVSNQASGVVTFGGALYASAAMTITDSRWLNNSTLSPSASSANGGAIYAECTSGCLYDLRRGFFGGNQAGVAGALFVRSGTQFFSTLSLQNLSFVDNRALGSFTTAAGAVYLDGLAGTILEASHLSFQSNQGQTAHIVMQGNGSQIRSLHNSVFGRGATAGCLFTAQPQAASANVVTDSNCQLSTTAFTLIPTLADGPVIARAEMSVVAYGPSSPVIDTANSAQCPATDALGSNRPRDGNADGIIACDIGAYELVDAIFRNGFE